MAEDINAVRASRELLITDAYAKQNHANEQLAARQAQDAAAAARTEIDRRPTYEEAVASTKKAEGEYFKSLFKGGISNLGLAVDLGTMGYNYISGKLGGKQVAPDQPFGGEWFKDAFLGPQPTQAEIAGFENGQWSLDPSVVVTGGLKIAANTAGMLPLIFMKDTKKIEGLTKTYQKFASEFQKVTVGSPEWHELNRDMYTQTGGLMIDYAGKPRWHVPDSRVEFKPEFVNETGNLKPLPPGTTLGSALNNTEFLDELHPMYRQMILDIPLNDLSATLPKNVAGQMNPKTGMNLGFPSFDMPQAEVVKTILHELEHMFQFNIGSSRGANYTKIAQDAGIPDMKVELADNLNAYTSGLSRMYKDKMGAEMPPTLKQTLTQVADVYARAAYEGKPLPDTIKENIALFEGLYPGYKQLLNDNATFFAARKQAERIYKGAAGEVMARVAEKAREAGYPFSHVDMPVDQISGKGASNLPYQKVPSVKGAAEMPWELVVRADMQERVWELAEAKGLLNDVDLADPEQVADVADNVAASITPDELKTLIEQQARDAAQVGSKFESEWARGNYAKAIKDAGADLAKGRLASDNPNAAFPSKGSRKDLDPTYQQALKDKGLTAADVTARNRDILGTEGLEQSRLAMAEKLRTWTSVAGVDAKKGVTKEDRAMRVPDSQGVKDVETGGGGLPPRDPSSFGARMEEAGTYATGIRSRVWQGGNYDAEQAINRNSQIVRERFLAASKIPPSNTSSKIRKEATPTFWAWDPVRKSVFAVRRKPDGGLEVYDRTSKGRMPDNWRDMVDDTMTKEELDQAIAKAAWDRVSLRE